MYNFNDWIRHWKFSTFISIYDPSSGRTHEIMATLFIWGYYILGARAYPYHIFYFDERAILRFCETPPPSINRHIILTGMCTRDIPTGQRKRHTHTPLSTSVRRWGTVDRPHIPSPLPHPTSPIGPFFGQEIPPSPPSYITYIYKSRLWIWIWNWNLNWIH